MDFKPGNVVRSLKEEIDGVVHNVYGAVCTVFFGKDEKLYPCDELTKVSESMQ